MNSLVPNIQELSYVYDVEGNVKFDPRIVGGKKAKESDIGGLVSFTSFKFPY